MDEKSFPIHYTHTAPIAADGKMISSAWKKAAVLYDHFHIETLKKAPKKISLSLLFDEGFLYVNLKTLSQTPFVPPEQPSRNFTTTHARLFLPSADGNFLLITFDENGSLYSWIDDQEAELSDIRYVTKSSENKSSYEWESTLAVPFKYIFPEDIKNISSIKFSFFHFFYKRKYSSPEISSIGNPSWENTDHSFWTEAEFVREEAVKKKKISVRKDFLQKNETADFVIEPEKTYSPYKNILGMNNSPRIGIISRSKKEKELFKRLSPARVRYHDAAATDPGFSLVDVSRIFPLFHADHNDPANYDFAPTDLYLQQVVDCGIPIEFKFGETIEGSGTLFRVIPPSDPEKWAQICVNILRHYNEGWANGKQWNISYASLWEEPDGISNLFGGPYEKYLELYKHFSLNMIQAFPYVKLGGPQAISLKKIEEFIIYCKENSLPLDFIGTTQYARTPEEFKYKLTRMKELAVQHGYPDAEISLAEWHYSPSDWDNAWDPTEAKGIENAAFSIASLIHMQKTADMACYYLWAAYHFFGLMVHWTKPFMVYYAFCLYTEFIRTISREIAFSSPAVKQGVYLLAGSDEEKSVHLLLSLFRSPAKQISFTLPPAYTSCIIRGLSSDSPAEEKTMEIRKDQNGVFHITPWEKMFGVYFISFRQSEN